MLQSVPSSLRTRLRCGTHLTAAGLAIALAAGAAPAAAQSQPGGEVTELEEVFVTGSRIARDGFEASTPVTVLGQEDVRAAGTVNIEELLSESPQFVASTNGGATGNTVPGGTADVNLRGFGPQRNLVLVNGRRFAIIGPEQTTDINTIPTALIDRTEVVTGGSSAVYGSDAITGVVNFIMRDDFEGVEASAQVNYDQPTGTPTYNADLTFGGNFSEGRGNAVISLNYLNRGSITRRDRGDFAFYSLSDGCVTSQSWSETEPGVPFSPPAGQTCRGAGGRPGLIAGGSGDIPNGRFYGIPSVGSAQSNPGLDAALIAAGLGNLGSRGFTFNDTGANPRIALTPQDDFNLAPDNYLQVPQERWMVNAFSHFDFHEKATGYAEFHFSNNRVEHQLAPSNIGGQFLFDVNNPYLNAATREVLRQLDLRETGATTVVTGTSSRTTTPGDGLAAIQIGRRLSEVGLRRNVSDRNVWRMALGLRGELGSLSENFLRDVRYDVYYTFARTEETSRQAGNVSRSRFQSGLLSSGGAQPLLNIFGPNISQAGAQAIAIAATNYTEAEQQVAAANLSGELFDLPAGPVGFAFGGEWRYSSANFIPDEFLRSGDVVGFNPGLPTGGSVTAREVFGEVRVPILKDLPLVESLIANGAFRWSDYDLEGVGAVWTYLYGADWRVNPDLAFRGQYQRAIRAPNVGELYGGLRRSVDPATDPCSSRQPTAQRTEAVRAICVASGVPTAAVFTAGVQSNDIIEAFFGGNPNVGEEVSDTRTFGAVLTPRFLPRFAMSVDYFDIKLDGAIGALGGGLNNTLNLCFNIIQNINSEFCQAIDRNPVTGEIGGQYRAEIRNANTGALETSGVDIEARYAWDMDWGLFGEGSRFSVRTNWTWTEEFTSTPVEAFPNITNECVGSFGTTCGEPIPEWKGVTRLAWDSGRLGLSLRHRYIGEVVVDRYVLPTRRNAVAPALEDLTNPVLEAEHYFDLSFKWDLTDDALIYGGVRNLLDNDPPVVGSSQIRNNTWAATYDYAGREFFLGATLKFN